MSELAQYKRWCDRAVEDPDLQTELSAIESNEDAVYDRFYRDLEFGTGGLRGVLGAGSFRMNIYTVRRATQGLADYVNEAFDNPAVAISFDSRIKSDLFAKNAARVLAANGITVHLFSELAPTPLLSYAVRALGCQAGIMVTASHNPAKYNGYKAYGPDGCQLTLEAAEAVLDRIESVDMFDGAKVSDFDKSLAQGTIRYIPQSLIEAYLGEVEKQAIHPGICKDAGLKVVYTPLNGAGNVPVREILCRIGVKDVHVVPEQERPDGTFATCPFPNPEIPEALELGLRMSRHLKADLLLATDPDSDRVGIAVPAGSDYALISGNEVGALLLEYICRERTKLGTMPKRPLTVKTIVTTELVDAIAAEYGVDVVNTLTGFKFIGEQIGFLEEEGEEDRYIFGFEESYGYLAGTYVRDKDAVVASMLICEMAAFYRAQGIGLADALDALYAKYGNFLHKQQSFTCEGASGMQRMQEIMAGLRAQIPASIAGLAVRVFADYQASAQKDLVTGAVSELTLPKSDVLVYSLDGGASVIIRPSGTEPKIKVYYSTKAATKADAEAQQKKLAEAFTALLGF